MRVERRHVWIAVAVAATAGVTALVMRPDVVEVEVATVTRGPLRVTVDEDGETRVRERYVLSAPVTGRLVRVELEVGDSVAAGDVVARVYPLPLDTRAREEVAERLRAAEATEAAAEATVARAEAVWGEARRSLERLERVEAEGYLTPQRMDEARTAERSAALSLEQARRAAEATRHEAAAARATLQGSAGAASGTPTLVRAPAAGRVLRLWEECERAVAAGAPIAEVGDPDDLEVVVDVLTEDAVRLAPGATALVSAGPRADTLRGRVLRVEPAAFTKVSPLGVEEQRVNVVVAFDGPPPVLGDRFRVDASLVAWEAADALRVPVGALFRTGGGGWGVFVVEEGRARLRALELGERGRREAEARSGLDEGEAVILYPGEAVEEGARVRPAGG